jgi:ABC-type lipoprotein export system ATPase subunit
LNIIGTLDRPDAGSVELDGVDLLAMDEKATAGFRNARIGFVFQLHHLLPQCSVLENVLVPTLVNKDSTGATERALQLLERVGLSDRLLHRPGKLSGGERQRVAVVRALINRPQLLLADEPTGSLSRAGADELVQLLLELNREENLTLVMVTHSMRLAEKMDRVLVLEAGKVK